MRKGLLLLLGILLLPGWTLLPAQEEQTEEKKFEWTPDLDWEPPAELLAGIEKIGELSTHLKSLKISYPSTIKVVGDKLYLFDVQIEKLLLFDAAGNFQRSLFAEDQRITSPIFFMDVDEKGRALLNDFQTIYIFESNEITSRENYQRIGEALLDGERIRGSSGVATDTGEVPLTEVSVEGELVDRWGKLVNDEYFVKNRMIMLGSLCRWQGKYLTMFPYFDGFGVLEPQAKTQRTVEFNIPEFKRRIQLTKESMEYREKTKSRSMKIFPVFTDMEVLDDDIYLFLNDRQFISVLLCDSEGTIHKVFRGMKSPNSNPGRFAVSKVEGEPRFFIITGELKEDQYLQRVDIYAPCDEAPTLADIEKSKEEKSEADKLAEEKRNKQREAYEAFRAADEKAGKTESAEEKRLSYYEVAEKYPDSRVAAYALQNAAGREPSAEVAAEVLAHLDAALAEASEDDVVKEYLQGRAFLCGFAGKADELRKTVERLRAGEIDLRTYMTLSVAAAKVEDWPLLLECGEAALAAATPETLGKTYGGMPESRMKEYLDRYKSTFLIARGRALTNLERVDEALNGFQAAAEVTAKVYTGNYFNDLDLHWAAALSKAGRREEAVETLLPGALFSGNAEKVDALREIYESMEREESYKDFLWGSRLERARRLNDAEFCDYNKNPVKLSSKLGKATIITFWTPST